MSANALFEWSAARRALLDQVSKTVVGVEPARGACCSGILWDETTIVTAAEALQGAGSVTVRTGGTALDAAVIAADLTTDVAVLRIGTGALPASVAAQVCMAPPDSLAAGDDLLTAGSKRGLAFHSWGHAQLVGPGWRSRRGGELARYLRLSPGLDSALEGAGVFDLKGRLCAMAVPGPRRQVLGIPVETIARTVATIRLHGRLPQPYLGVRLQPVGLDRRQREHLYAPESASRPAVAALVVGVEDDSPAAAGGLLFGDVLLSIGGAAVHTALDVKAAITSITVGSSVPVRVYRAGAHRELDVTISERPGV